MPTSTPFPSVNRLSAWTGVPIFSRKWNAEEGIPDLAGKVAIVTGGNTGIGYATTEQLLKHGCKVYLACRSESRANEAIASLIKTTPSAEGRAIYLPFDLTDLASAEKASKTVLEKEERLDIIIANAGIMAWPYEIKNGVEVQFWNHLGHFALIQPLLSLLIKTSKLPDTHVRIVNVSSYGHTMSPRPDFSSLETVNKPLRNTWARYGQSKLANILYTVALQNRLGDEKIRCAAVHPGVVASELIRGQVGTEGVIASVAKFVTGMVLMTPQEGAKTQLWAATSPEVDEHDLKAAYVVPIAQVATPSSFAQDHALADELWRFSEQAIKTLKANA